MSISAKLSNKLNILPHKDLIKIISMFKENNLPTNDEVMYDDKIFQIIKKDKKNIEGAINYILVKKIGSSFLTNKLSLEKIKKKLKEI